jgi:hypothetical protein
MKRKTARNILSTFAELEKLYLKLANEHVRLYDLDQREDDNVLDDIGYTMGKIAEAKDGLEHHVEDAQDALEE